jgi:hypothetical protein
LDYSRLVFPIVPSLPNLVLADDQLSHDEIALDCASDVKPNSSVADLDLEGGCGDVDLETITESEELSEDGIFV